MDTGRDINDVRVASPEWVTMPYTEGETKSRDTLTGQRRLPPLNSYVYCLMPSGEPSSAIALCSVFPTADPNYDAFKEDSEDAGFIDEKVDSGGWKFIHDIRTGTRKTQNSPKDGEETIKIEIDQEEKGSEKVIITIHGNIFTVDKDNGIDVKSDKNFTGHFKGKSVVDVTGNAEYKSADTDIKSIKPVGINGGGNNLNAACLRPYWNAETVSWKALQSIVTNPMFMIQMTLLDAVSGGIGSIIALANGLIALCLSQIAAESSAISASTPIIK
jgi:hypothetical protein